MLDGFLPVLPTIFINSITAPLSEGAKIILTILFLGGSFVCLKHSPYFFFLYFHFQSTGLHLAQTRFLGFLFQNSRNSIVDRPHKTITTSIPIYYVNSLMY